MKNSPSKNAKWSLDLNSDDLQDSANQTILKPFLIKWAIINVLFALQHIFCIFFHFFSASQDSDRTSVMAKRVSHSPHCLWVFFFFYFFAYNGYWNLRCNYSVNTRRKCACKHNTISNKVKVTRNKMNGMPENCEEERCRGAHIELASFVITSRYSFYGKNADDAIDSPKTINRMCAGYFRLKETSNVQKVNAQEIRWRKKKTQFFLVQVIKRGP